MNLFQRLKQKFTFSFLVDAANWRQRWQRPQEPITINSLPQEVSLSDWRVIVSDSRKLYWNVGPAKGAIQDKATYAIGRAWDAKFVGKDQAWGKIAEKWVNEQWYPMADVRGGMFDFKSDLHIASVSIDRDGEVYVILTESKEGWPMLQFIPATMIGCRDQDNAVIETGPYKGLTILQGIIVNKLGRAVAYRVLGLNPEDDRDYSARDMIQIFDPEAADQLRGFPCFTAALLDLKDLRTVQGYEKSATALASSLGLIVSNETGTADPNDPMTKLTQQRSNMNIGFNDTPTTVTEDVQGATTRYIRAGTGSKIESLKTDRPGPNWESFMDRLIRNACQAAGWPFELTWDSSKLGGANIRLLVARAMRSVEDRQDLLRPVAKRLVGYAVAKAIKQGILPENDEWYAWSFGLPGRMSVDYGRDGNSDREDYKLGLTNLTDILEEQGKNLDQHIAERKAENEKLIAAGLPVVQPNGTATVQPPTT